MMGTSSGSSGRVFLGSQSSRTAQNRQNMHPRFGPSLPVAPSTTSRNQGTWSSPPLNNVDPHQPQQLPTLRWEDDRHRHHPNAQIPTNAGFYFQPPFYPAMMTSFLNPAVTPVFNPKFFNPAFIQNLRQYNDAAHQQQRVSDSFNFAQQFNGGRG